MSSARVHPALLLIVTLALGPAWGDMGSRRTVAVPQLVVPLGDLSDLAGTGVGIGVEWYRPLDPELTLVTSVGFLGFRRQTNVDALLSLDGLLAVPADRDVHTEYEVIAVPVLVGVKYSTPEFFVGVGVGDLFTRVEERTLLRTDSLRRASGRNSRSRHGLLLSVSAGLERRNVSFAGLRLGFSPRIRGPGGESNFTWLSIFISI